MVELGGGGGAKKRRLWADESRWVCRFDSSGSRTNCFVMVDVVNMYGSGLRMNTNSAVTESETCDDWIDSKVICLIFMDVCYRNMLINLRKSND